MTDRPLLSATLICKDEKSNVRRLFDSIWKYCDEICVVDTGSTDGTIAEMRRYATARKQPKKLKVKRVKWTDDFAAARQAADEMATGEWVCWADMDDVVVGLESLRKMAAEASEQTVAFFVKYSYAADRDGNSISELWRERVVRNDGTRWAGRLHEHKLFTQGHVIQVDPKTAEWVHHRDHTERTAERNLRILEAWLADEPQNPRVISSLGMEYMGADRHQESSDMFARFLAIPGEPADRRCQAARHMCQMLLMQGRAAEARQAALTALGEEWLWADTHLTLAEAEQTLGRPDVGLRHARQALELGKPETLLIVNPLQYTAHPHAVMGVCYAQMGRFEDAVREAEECLAIAPSYQLAVQYLPMWRGQLRKQHALGAFLASAELLVETGEALKARDLLAAAPYFIADDPRIVARRVEVDRLIGERLRGEAPLADDEAADLFVKRHMELAA